MKTFTNDALTFKDEQLLKDAIEIIVDETIVHNQTDKSTFIIYGNINVLIKTDHAEIGTDSESLVQLDDANKLLNFILVETNKLKGIWHLRDRGAYLSDLSLRDKQHISRLSKTVFSEKSEKGVYDMLVYSKKTPKEFQEEFKVSAKFITALRKANRKMIVSSVIDEVISQNNRSSRTQTKGSENREATDGNRKPNPNRMPNPNKNGSSNTQTKSSENKEASNIVDRGKITKGKIGFYNKEGGWGKIYDKDSKQYFFHFSNFDDESHKIEEGLFVLFISCQGPKGLCAENVTMDNHSYNSKRDTYITNNSGDTYITNNYNNDDDHDDDYYDDDDDVGVGMHCKKCGYTTNSLTGNEPFCRICEAPMYFDPLNGIDDDDDDYYDNDDDDYDDNDDNDDDDDSEENGYGIQNRESARRYYDSNCPECESKLWQYSNGYVKCGESWCGWWNYLAD